MQTGQRLILVKLLHQLLAGSFEMGRVLRRPPVREFAFGIKFRALIIEAVADLVPDGSADGCAPAAWKALSDFRKGKNYESSTFGPDSPPRTLELQKALSTPVK